MPGGTFATDILTRIINVHWAGGTIFVIGDDSGQIWRCVGGSAPNFEKMKQQFGVNNPSSGTTPPGQCNGGSFALVGEDKTPTFVLAGIDWQFDHYASDGSGRGLFTDGLIMTSKDGITWTTAFKTETTINGASRTPRRVIWDEAEQNFFVDMAYVSAQPPDADRGYATECWSSPTGHVWTMIGSLPGQVLNTIFEAHCKYKWSLPELAGVGFANGEFGIDPAKKDSTDKPILGKIVADGLLITQEDMIPFDTSGINFAGGTWGRGNFEAFEISSDDGGSWKVMGKVIYYDPEIQPFGRVNIICAGTSG
jgi:hypothetical protein